MQKLITFIEKYQKRNGSFPGITFNTGDGSQKSSDTTFITSLILSCIGDSAGNSEKFHSKHPQLQSIARKGVNFLLKEKSALWTWNYWSRGNKEANKHPCPDDMDDTSCALIALSLHRKQAISAEAFASISKVLIATEEKPGGPYNTWIMADTSKKEWHDIDIVVNSNIAYFLDLHEIHLPVLAEYIDAIIRKKAYESKYYSPLHSIYFISRSYKGNLKADMISHIMNIPKENVLDTALAVSALINLGASETLYKKMLDEIATLSSWPAIPFYIEAIKGKPLRSGSAALTAAFCLEALRKYDEMRINKNGKKNAGQKVDKNERERQNLHTKIIAVVQKELNIFSPKITEIIGLLISKMTERDPGKQITLLPYHTAKAMTQETKKATSKISPAFLTELGSANLYGWLAYKIYDDILDNEGNPLLLPVANLCARKVTEIYTRLLPASYLKTFHSMMNDMEKANAWERERAYFPEKDFFSAGVKLPDYGDYRNLAYKSLPHCLGAVALMAQKDIKKMTDFFYHYIIARQLNDDAHDWLPDLEKGFVNSSGTKVLAKKRASTATGDELRKVFWYEVIDEIIPEIRKHIKKALSAIESVSGMNDKSYFLSLLEPIKRATEKALKERDDVLSFLKTGHIP